MSIYSLAVDVSAQNAYQAAPDVVVPFMPLSIVVVNEHLTAQVAVSFDGTNDHWVFTPGTPGAGLRFSQRVSKVWCRRVGAGANIIMRVEAES